MTDFGKIAEKFKKRRVRSATFRPPEPYIIDDSCKLFSRYPTVSLICLAEITIAIAIISRFLIWAIPIIGP